ncbi:MAG: HAD family hydrolase [Thiotrichales bacterium]
MHIVLISVHGLIRGRDMELGRDADTGGQILYVVELARALAQHPEVSRVDLLTRRLNDPAISPDYGIPEETIGDRVRIVRIEAGPAEYLRKETLWDHLDDFADNALEWLRGHQLSPNLIHSHYADAGYVGVRLASLLGVPLIHTGHSLGRVKRQRLLATGLPASEIDLRYNMRRRIEAEELTLGAAERVITSTRNEIDEQYGLYDHYAPERMVVIPPGVDLSRFHPPDGSERSAALFRSFARFLREPDKPMILALSRADERKNLTALIEAYGQNPTLQSQANLIIVAGNREDIAELDEGPKKVLQEVLIAVDRYDLYGKVAYPKHHGIDDVPEFYRLAAASGGVFVNPALTEPFGLTLLEAAASGLPVVATEDGGPQDIIANCSNGLLINPLDPASIADALSRVLSDRGAWTTYARNGLSGVRRHYLWSAHAETYLDVARPLLADSTRQPRLTTLTQPPKLQDRAIFSDLDQSLLGDPNALHAYVKRLRAHRRCVQFGIATGRGLATALRLLRQYEIPEPDVLITSLGTQINYAPKFTADQAWIEHIDHLWTPHVVRRLLAGQPGITPQPREHQDRFKLSYYYDPAKAAPIEELQSLLRHHDQTVNMLLSFGQFLDVVPIRASKGLALRYWAHKREQDLARILVAGGSGADEDMMRGHMLAVVVANRHHEELSGLSDRDRIYFATQPYAAGILEAIDHYDFFDTCRVPSRDDDALVSTATAP